MRRVSRLCFSVVNFTMPKELFKIEGATHIETYWVPEYVAAR